MRAIVYSRVSTDPQERHGTSLETKERACLTWAEAEGWTDVEQIRDSASGFSLDRPGLNKACLLIRTGQADVLLAYAVDRPSRNQSHWGTTR
jgi:site-specific DNA recombinase